jgi:CRP-like cAMP-binding protein
MESSLKLNHVTTQILAQIPFFKDMDKEYLEMLSKKMLVLNKQKGDLIISEGDEDKIMYFIIQGTVNIIRKNHKGRTEIIYELNEPSYFGEMAIMDGGLRSASVEAKTDVVLAELKWDDVRCLFEDKPEIMSYMFRNIGSMISMRLRRANSLSWRLTRI